MAGGTQPLGHEPAADPAGTDDDTALGAAHAALTGTGTSSATSAAIASEAPSAPR